MSERIIGTVVLVLAGCTDSRWQTTGRKELPAISVSTTPAVGDTGRNTSPSSTGDTSGGAAWDTFDPPVTLETAFSCTLVEASDINGDGTPDLRIHENASTVLSYDTQSFFNGLPIGSGLAPATHPQTGNPIHHTHSNHAGFGDLDGDGLEDTVSSGAISSFDTQPRLLVMFREDEIAFETTRTAFGLPDAGQVYHVDVMDADGDEIEDVVSIVADQDGSYGPVYGRLWLHRGLGERAFATAQNIEPHLVELADSTFSWRTGAGGPALVETRRSPFDPNVWTTSVRTFEEGLGTHELVELEEALFHPAFVADAAGDEVLYGSRSSREVVIYDAAFEHPMVMTTASQQFSFGVADFDGDGVLDIATGHAYDGSGLGDRYEIRLGTSTGFTEPVVTIPLPSRARAGRSAVVDLDGDGALDIALCSEDGLTVILTGGR